MGGVGRACARRCNGGRRRRAAERRILAERVDGTSARRLAHERRQPLQPALLTADADRPQQRGAAQGSLAHPFERLRRRAAVFGRSAADRPRRRRLRHHRRRRRVRVVRRHWRDPVAVPGEYRLQDHVGLLRVDEPRRRNRRRQDLRRQARRPPRGARSTNGPRGLVDPSRALGGRLFADERAALLRRHGDHGVRGRRDRRARPREGVRRR